MYFPDRGCVRPLRHLYGYATVLYHSIIGLADSQRALVLSNTFRVITFNRHTQATMRSHWSTARLEILACCRQLAGRKTCVLTS